MNGRKRNTFLTSRCMERIICSLEQDGGWPQRRWSMFSLRPMKRPMCGRRFGVLHTRHGIIMRSAICGTVWMCIPCPDSWGMRTSILRSATCSPSRTRALWTWRWRLVLCSIWSCNGSMKPCLVFWTGVTAKASCRFTNYKTRKINSRKASSLGRYHDPRRRFACKIERIFCNWNFVFEYRTALRRKKWGLVCFFALGRAVFKISYCYRERPLVSWNKHQGSFWMVGLKGFRQFSPGYCLGRQLWQSDRWIHYRSCCTPREGHERRRCRPRRFQWSFSKYNKYRKKLTP